MGKIIEYFLKNSRLNYTLLLFILIMGVFSYIKIPKEMFPTVTLDSIQVSGSYSGASADNLNNFAVKEIEGEIPAENLILLSEVPRKNLREFQDLFIRNFILNRHFIDFFFYS